MSHPPPRSPEDSSDPLVFRKTKPNVLQIANAALKNRLVVQASSSRCTPEIMVDKMEKRDIVVSSASSITSGSNSSAAHKRVKNKKSKDGLVLQQNDKTVDIVPDVVTVVVDTIAGEVVYMDFSNVQSPCVARFSPLMNLDIVERDHLVTNVVVDNMGYYTSRPGKGRSIIASSVFEFRSMKQTFRDVGYMDERSGLIFVPLYKELVHLFKAHREDTHLHTSHLQAIKNVVSAFKNRVKMPLTQHFIEEFNNICDYTEAYYRIGVKVSNNSTRAQNNLELPGTITKLTSLVVRTGCVQVHNCVDLPINKTPEPYDIKFGTKFINKNGVVPLTKNMWFGEPPVDLKYSPTPVDAAATGRATHQWCSLVRGVRYANSTWNQYWAMQRIFKARDGEETYQLNQYRLSIALVNVFPSLIKNMAIMGVGVTTIDRDLYASTFLDWDFVYTINKYPALATVPNYTYMDVLDICKLYKPLTDFYDSWSVKMGNTLGESLVDITYNTLNVIKYNVYTYWQSMQMPLLVRTEWASLPGPKKMERQRMVQGTILETNIQDKVIISVKDEIAKSCGHESKMPRLFTSYGVGCCLAPGLPDVAKKHMNGWYMFNVGSLPVCIIAYTLPKTTELELLFDELISATMRSDNYLCVAFYSDDSCYAGCINGVRFGYNVDISSCDSSNGVPIFYAVTSMLSSLDSEMAPLLLQQCCQPLKFNVPGDPSKNFSVKPASVFEGSGTVLTTVLNHTASVGIAICTALVLTRKVHSREVIDIKQAIIDGGLLVGHKITVCSIEVDGVLEPSKFQFLKYSPMLAQHKVSKVEKYIPVRNFGCIVKGFGQLKEPMQGRQLSVSTGAFSMMTMSEKFDKFLSGVVRGYCNEPSSPLLSALRTRFSCQVDLVTTDFVLVEQNGDYSTYDVLPSSITARYGLENTADMVRTILDLQVGDVVTDYAMETFMVVDYDAAYSQYILNPTSYV